MKIALPCLHPGTALSRVIKFNTDADPQEVRAIEVVTGKEVVNVNIYANVMGNEHNLLTKVMPNTRAGRCVFHKFDRNLTSDPRYKSIIAAAKDKSVLARAKTDMLLQWI